ncbi:unnamed protein product, partial [Ectocarpus sp. 8 AP-2014]
MAAVLASNHHGKGRVRVTKVAVVAACTACMERWRILMATRCAAFANNSVQPRRPRVPLASQNHPTKRNEAGSGFLAPGAEKNNSR